MRAGRGGLLITIALGSACGGAAPHAARDPSDPALDYTVTLAPALDAMSVSVCPRAAALPEAFVPVHAEGRDHVARAAVTRDPDPATWPPFDGRIAVTDASDGACLRYEVDLSTCTQPRGPSDCARSGRDLFAPTSTWLLAPETRRRADRYAMRFVLPDGVFVTPLAPEATREPERVVLDERSFAFVTYLAFVHAAPRPFAVPGACVDLVTLEGELDAPREAQIRWLREATAASARVTGRPPFDRLTAIVVPSLDVPAMPVLFGVAGRGMRPSVTLLVGAHAREDALVPDWTAVHELAHFLTAYVEGEDAWLSEGLATYLEEVLRARQGLRTETQTWAALLDGFARGRADSGSGTLREVCSAMHTSRRFTHVYWGGAAIVFLADVAYRRAGSSLDEAIGRAWEHRGERASASDLMTWLDGGPDGTLASVASEALDGATFPDLAPTLAWLGVAERDGRVVLDDAAPGASVRIAMMNAPSPLPSNPSTCATPTGE